MPPPIGRRAAMRFVRAVRRAVRPKPTSQACLAGNAAGRASNRASWSCPIVSDATLTAIGHTAIGQSQRRLRPDALASLALAFIFALALLLPLALPGFLIRG